MPALCHTKQRPGCQCHKEYAGFGSFLPLSYCSNCSLVFLRESSVQLQERKQIHSFETLKQAWGRRSWDSCSLWYMQMSSQKNHPCGWAFPSKGLHAHALRDTHQPIAVCPGSFSAGGRLQLLSGRHRLPWSYDSAWATVCTTTQSLFPNRLARGNKHHNGKYLCAVGLAGGWGHGGRWAPMMGLAKICPPIRCPGAKATQPLQHKVQRFGWSRGWQQVHINMPPSALKPLKCKDRFVSNCSGESGLLGALTF